MIGMDANAIIGSHGYGDCSNIVGKFGMGQRNGLYTGALLSQIGEFGLVLIAIGMKGKILFQYEFQLAISVISLSLLVSPLWIYAIRRFNAFLGYHKRKGQMKIKKLQKVSKISNKKEVKKSA